MRIGMIGILGAAALTLSACGGSGGDAVSQLRPPAPINLSVYVNDAAISVSPSSIGAGPVVFTVTNRANHSEALAISRSGHSQPIASTAPINPQGTTQVTVNFAPGRYTITSAPHGSTDASLAAPSALRPALIRIGRERLSASNALQVP